MAVRALTGVHRIPFAAVAVAGSCLMHLDGPESERLDIERLTLVAYRPCNVDNSDSFLAVSASSHLCVSVIKLPGIVSAIRMR